MVFGLGVRHGFDLDHLATIDSITRTLKANSHLSKRVGFLFSLGHGIVVILTSLLISNGFFHAALPLWLESFGNWVSIVFLFIFGFLTLWNLSSNAPTYNYSIRKIPFIGHSRPYNSFLIILVGALFAFSFDTFTQVVLFSISLSGQVKWYFSIILGITFMSGMMTSDGLNGLLVASLIRCADKSSMTIARLIGLLIAGFSLILGLQELLKQLVNTKF
ncbi:hypothetical protein [Legionella brunensis]|uniref:Nickel/cobalt efflux system n=1 Tax=Legionella brunensis TaxID=29422 RepID=A0A0W0ST69_9GAMM|nr:hypothetical protein [Legionella brunensis]KTC86566.1 high-affinity nickel-transport protein [Legionella brunensis]